MMSTLMIMSQAPLLIIHLCSHKGEHACHAKVVDLQALYTLHHNACELVDLLFL